MNHHKSRFRMTKCGFHPFSSEYIYYLTLEAVCWNLYGSNLRSDILLIKLYLSYLSFDVDMVHILYNFVWKQKLKSDLQLLSTRLQLGTNYKNVIWFLEVNEKILK